jgi:hypothetical protein
MNHVTDSGAKIGILSGNLVKANNNLDFGTFPGVP